MEKSEVQWLMVDDITRSGLTEKDIKLLHLSSEPHKLVPNVAGYTIPYFDASGMLTKFYRVRYVESTVTGFAALTGQKPQRYSQPPGTINELYMPPYIDWEDYFGGILPLMITEGEKKSALATKLGIPTVGLGGVWCFMSKKAKVTLLPIFDEINLDNRLVCICFDSDAATNPNILAAEGVLAQRLVERGAVVVIARIPPGAKGKVGLDDYLLTHTKELFQSEVLDKAFEYAESEALHGMNSNLVYLRSIGTIYDYTNKMRISATSFVQHSHSNLWIDVPTTTPQGQLKMVRKNAAKLWLEWGNRAELKTITYEPGKPMITDEGELNMWKGWGVKDAVPGSVALWSKLLDLLFEGSKPGDREWFERWCAYPIQHPGYKMATAVVFWGVTQGTGKSTVGYTLMRLYGDNAIEVKDANLKTIRFEWAENKQFVLGDDITGHDNRKLSNTFKTMITQKTIYVDPKFITPYTIPDRINYYFTSNDPNAFYLDDGDRRFFIHEVMSDKMPTAFRNEYIKWMNSEVGMQHLFDYFLNLDLGNFDPQAEALATEAKKEMTHISKSELGSWVAHLKDNPDEVLNGKTKKDLFTAEELYVIYDAMGDKKASPNALARELKRSGFNKITQAGGGAIYVAGARARLYVVRNADHWKSATAKEAADHYTDKQGASKSKKY